MSLPRTYYLIYSPAVAEQLASVITHPLLAEQGIELRKVKLADLSALHIDQELQHALLWIEQKDYPQALLFAQKNQMSLGFLPIKRDPPSYFLKNLDLPQDLDACLEIALSQEPIMIDTIVCNDEIVTNGVNLENQTKMTEFIGDSHEFKKPGAPCYLTKFRDSCRLNSFTYAANGRCPERPASVTTTHKSRFVITPSNGWTAIRNAILASLARYRALRLSELPCRLSGTKNHHFASAPFP